MMITMDQEEFDILTTELERLTAENQELRDQVDWLMRERMTPEELEREARKPMGAKTKMMMYGGDE